jgi:hypothetical protein
VFFKADAENGSARAREATQILQNILGLAGASIWLQKNVGKWTFDGGAGYQVVPQDAFRNFPFTGWLVKEELSEQLE